MGGDYARKPTKFILGQFYSHAYVIKGRLELTETNLMHFKWEGTTHENPPNSF